MLTRGIRLDLDLNMPDGRTRWNCGFLSAKLPTPGVSRILEPSTFVPGCVWFEQKVKRVDGWQCPPDTDALQHSHAPIAEMSRTIKLVANLEASVGGSEHAFGTQAQLIQ